MQDRALQPYFLIGALLGALVLTFYILKPFMAPLFLGAVFAVVLYPIYTRIRTRFGGREALASLATLVIALILILIPTFLLGFQLVHEAQQLYGSYQSGSAQESFTVFLGQAGHIAEGYVPGAQNSLANLSANLDTYMQSALTWIIQHFGVAFSSAAGIFLDLFLFFVALYFFLRDGEKLSRYLVQISPLSDRDDETILQRLQASVTSLVRGRLVISLAQGFLSGVGFLIFGVPNAVLWGLVAAIASIVPPIGTALVLAPAVAYLAFTSHIGAAIGLAIWGSLAVGLVDNLLAPYLMSQGLQLHPLLVLLSVLGGLEIFGPIGIFLGPLAMSLLLVLLSIYRDVSRRQE
jgi:predicted PurR-regulated permease PerM